LTRELSYASRAFAKKLKKYPVKKLTLVNDIVVVLGLARATFSEKRHRATSRPFLHRSTIPGPDCQTSSALATSKSRRLTAYSMSTDDSANGNKEGNLLGLGVR
jgi:hypothetical protein